MERSDRRSIPREDQSPATAVDYLEVGDVVKHLKRRPIIALSNVQALGRNRGYRFLDPIRYEPILGDQVTSLLGRHIDGDFCPPYRLRHVYAP